MSNSQAPDAFKKFLKRYGPAAGEDGPLLFVREVLGVTPDPWQVEVLRAFGRGERQIAVRSCHGPGKTATAAWCIVYMLICRFPQNTVATAPTAGQLERALMPEVKKWFGRLPDVLQALYEVKAGGIYLEQAPEESFFETATARAENPEALQGVHEEHVLLVGDEASGIPEAVFQSAGGSMSSENAQMLLISNPVRTSGYFYECFHGVSDMWETFHVSWEDSPRVTEDFEREIRRLYGEDSNAYRIRVLGEFPKSDQDTVIPFEFVEGARDRDIEEAPNAMRVWGLDVARFGDDRTVLTERSNRIGRVLDVWEQRDIMQTAGKVKARWDETPPHKQPRSILIDSVGLGSGVVDRLRELGLPARGVNVGETAALDDKYMRARSELWFRCREWLQGRDVALDADDDLQDLLASELVLPKFEYTSTGKIKVEPKSDTKKRTAGNKSPDVADSFILTFSDNLAKMVHGSAGSGKWSKPLKRDIKGVV